MGDQSSSNASRMMKDVRSGNDTYRQSFSSRRNSTRSSSSVVTDMEDNLQETPKRPRLEDSTNGLSFQSDMDPNSVPASPWEWRRMKGEIIALKTKISHQEATVEQLHKVRHEIEEVFHKEKKLLEIQAEHDKQMIKQLEFRVDMGRKTVQELRAAHARAERDISQVKTTLERKIAALIDENAKLTDELRKCVKQESKPDISVLKAEDNTANLEGKLEATQKRITELEKSLKEARSIQQKFELQCVEIQNLKIKVGTLESEKTMLEEGKQLSSRAARACELEKELRHAREIISSLRESVKGKLLLEEQMATIEHRLQRTESLEKQISELEITRGELLAKIADYEAIGISGGPVAIKREISRLQYAEAILTDEEGQLRSKVDSVQRELEESLMKHEETKKQLSELSLSHERLTRFISRLQKKMSLVTRERDSYRQQLDTYEKEITGYLNNEVPNLLNERIPALERAVEGYRELVTKLESDLEAVDGKSLQNEVKKLKDENNKLKDELAHRALKGDFNINTKILHFKMNPAAVAITQAEEKQKALLQEVVQLRAIVSSGNHAGAAPVSSLQAQEIAELQQKHELKITRLKEAFKASSHEYRQACYQLFGWRVDRTKESQYKLSSQYADSPDDYLFFIVNEDGVNMIETPFSATLTVFIERHLKLQHSVPMFLNAVQSDLFDQQTVTNVMQS